MWAQVELARPFSNCQSSLAMLCVEWVSSGHVGDTVCREKYFSPVTEEAKH
jgi:hypothetical protein